MSTKCKPKKVRKAFDYQASCDRKLAMLKEIASIINATRRDVRREKAEGRSGWRHLSAAVAKIRMIVRPKPGTFAWDTSIIYYLEHDPRLRLEKRGNK